MSNLTSSQNCQTYQLPVGHFVLNTQDIIAIISLIIAIIGLFYISKQLKHTVDTNKLNLLLGRYQFITEIQKFCFENPQYFKFWVGSERYKQISDLSDQEARDVAANDIIIDALEYLLLSGDFDNKDHQLEFTKRVLGNPRIQEFLTSKYAGSFRPEFQALVDEILKRDLNNL